MREIKFRAWDSPDKVWWGSMAMRDALDFSTASPDIVFMQYTGLKDKNGKEIYEGDIVETNYQGTLIPKGVVDHINAEFIMRDGSFVESLTNLVRNKWTLEVIGNIYENGDLLK